MKMAQWVVKGIVPFLVIVALSPAETFNWQSYGSDGDGAEIGITASEAGTIKQDPWIMESGYSGMFTFGINHPPYYGFAQEFTVESDRTLRSVEFRLCGRDNPQSGQFQLSILEYVTSPNEANVRVLATIFRDAGLYTYSYLETPISSFDLSAFNILLSMDKTYAVTLTPTATMTGTIGIHSVSPSAGPSYYVAIPEPTSTSLFLLAIGILVRPRMASYG